MFCRQASLAVKGRKPLRFAPWPRYITLQASCGAAWPGSGVDGVVGAGSGVLGVVGAGSGVLGVVGAGSLVTGVVGAGSGVVGVVGAGSGVVGVVATGVVGVVATGVVGAGSGVGVGVGVVGVVVGALVDGGAGVDGVRRLALKYREKKLSFEDCATANELAVKKGKGQRGELAWHVFSFTARILSRSETG